MQASRLQLEARHWSAQVDRLPPYIFYDQAEFDLIVEILGGQLHGRSVLDLGCGSGVWTANLAQLGAQVTAIDLGPSIVARALAMAQPLPASGCAADMHHLPFADDQFDLVFGSMVLHHAEHHEFLGREVARVLKPGGRAVFHENSARNPVLMLARSWLVGRFGVPKHSSPGEHPLMTQEIAAFGRAFAAHEVIVGRMVLAQLAVKYLLRRESGAVFTVARRLDTWLYDLCPACRHWSYYQIVAVTAQSSGRKASERRRRQ